MSQKVRVRFAPSPTGPLHIGGVRTALYNFLFARKHGGDFILRIEDTDQRRYVEGAEAYIVEALKWLHIPFDEGPGKEGSCGPYRQSQRKKLYRQYAETLLTSGQAYYAFDTPEELASLRKDNEAHGKTFIYNWHNRGHLTNSISLSAAEVEKRVASGAPYVIRFKVPHDEILKLSDLVRGNMEINTAVLDDKVLFKSDGMPTYHLANIVDDHLMKISHVIRGEEWLPSLALHILLYRAFGWNPPEFAHLPLLMKPEGKGKLSKRDGDRLGFPVFPLEWSTANSVISSGYREDGYLPEAVLNMLALLGWNPGTEQEIFSLEELVVGFDLKRVNKAGARFDPEKTKWFQHHYLQQVDNATLAKQLGGILVEKGISSSINLTHVVSLLKERATFVTDIWEQGRFFFEAPQEYDEKASKKACKEDTPQLLQFVVEILSELDGFSAAHISEKVKDWITKESIGFGRVMMPLRLSLVGAMQGPDVFEIIALLGKEESVLRIQKAIAFCS